MEYKIIITNEGYEIPLEDVIFLKDGIVTKEEGDLISHTEYTIKTIKVDSIDMTMKEYIEDLNLQDKIFDAAYARAEETFIKKELSFDFHAFSEAFKKVHKRDMKVNSFQYWTFLQELKSKENFTYTELDVYGFKTKDYLDFCNNKIEESKRWNNHLDETIKVFKLSYKNKSI